MGNERLVKRQLGMVIWMCSSMHGRTVARSHKILRKMMTTVTNTATMCLSNLLLNKLLLTSTAITTHDHLLVIQFSCFPSLRSYCQHTSAICCSSGLSTMGACGFFTWFWQSARPL